MTDRSRTSQGSRVRGKAWSSSFSTCMNPSGIAGDSRKRQRPCHKTGQQWLSCEPFTQALRFLGSTRAPAGGRGTCCLDEGRQDALRQPILWPCFQVEQGAQREPRLRVLSRKAKALDHGPGSRPDERTRRQRSERLMVHAGSLSFSLVRQARGGSTRTLCASEA